MLVITISVNELNTAESFSSQIVSEKIELSEEDLKKLNTKLRWLNVDNLNFILNEVIK